MEEVVKELSKKYNKDERVIKIMLESCYNLGYNKNVGIKLIANYFNL